MDFIRKKEFWVWSVALTVLFFMPFGNGNSLCVSHLIGWHDCPGCGLGTGIHHAMHGNFEASFASHSLAIPALIVLFHRLYSLIRKQPTPTRNESRS